MSKNIDLRTFIIEKHLNYDDLNAKFTTIINAIDSKDFFDVLKIIAEKKPIIKFKTFYAILSEFTNDTILNPELSALENLYNEDIDIFMLLNYFNK